MADFGGRGDIDVDAFGGASSSAADAFGGTDATGAAGFGDAASSDATFGGGGFTDAETGEAVGPGMDALGGYGGVDFGGRSDMGSLGDLGYGSIGDFMSMSDSDLFDSMASAGAMGFGDIGGMSPDEGFSMTRGYNLGPISETALGRIAGGLLGALGLGPIGGAIGGAVAGKGLSMLDRNEVVDLPFGEVTVDLSTPEAIAAAADAMNVDEDALADFTQAALDRDVETLTNDFSLNDPNAPSGGFSVGGFGGWGGATGAFGGGNPNDPGMEPSEFLNAATDPDPEEEAEKKRRAQAKRSPPPQGLAAAGMPPPNYVAADSIYSMYPGMPRDMIAPHVYRSG